MKKILIIIAAIISLSSMLKAQPKIDTLAHLKSIYVQKEKYIGKPFSVLQNDLKVNIVAFFPSAYPKNRFEEMYTGFYFINPVESYDFSTYNFTIYWQTPLNMTRSGQIFDMSEEGGGWLPEAKAFYKNAIIKDIDVSDDIKNTIGDPVQYIRKKNK